MKLAIYKKPTGEHAKIAEEYYQSMNILKRYTLEELKDWKNVDLYFILNVQTLRDEPLSEKLLQEQYRNQLLRYQKNLRGCSELFLVLQRAFNTLSNPVSRMKFDSIYFDEAIPEDRFYEEGEFFHIFSGIFKRNAKFSTKKPVPLLGDINDSKESVESFYKFWRNFESWRRFEYTDDDNTDGMNSADRRYHEKKSKANRDKLKREDIFRVKKLVDISLKRDPRVIKFRGASTPKMKIVVNKKLISKTWNELDLILLNDLMDKYKKGGKYDWARIVEDFNKSNENKKEQKDILIKGNEILRMGIKNK